MKTLDLTKISLTEKYADLPEDFKECFWPDAELRLKELKRNCLRHAWNKR